MLHRIPWTIVASLVACIAIVGGVIWFTYRPSSPPVSQSIAIADRELLSLTTQYATTIFPAERSADPIDLSAFDPEIVPLFDGVPSDTPAQRTVYEDGRTGFRIAHQVWPDLQFTYRDITVRARSLGWDVLAGARSTYAGVLELRSERYVIRISALYPQGAAAPTYDIQAIPEQ